MKLLKRIGLSAGIIGMVLTTIMLIIFSFFIDGEIDTRKEFIALFTTIILGSLVITYVVSSAAIKVFLNDCNWGKLILEDGTPTRISLSEDLTKVEEGDYLIVKCEENTDESSS